MVSKLYNTVFTAPEERAALNRLFNTFFKIPLDPAQQQKAAGKPPTLAEIAEQFRFAVAGEADVMLRIMESDPRMPRFMTRDAATGEITSVDVEAILAHPKFGKALERTITGWEGKPAPAFSVTTYDGKPLDLRVPGREAAPPLLLVHGLPAVRADLTAPRGARPGVRREGLRDRGPERGPGARAALLRRRAGRLREEIRLIVHHMTAEAQEAYGSVSVFPTLFFVDRKGTVVKHFVNFQGKAALEEAVRLTLQ